MDETTTSSSDGAATDPLAGDPRELMRALLPAARSEYIKAWELLADATTPLERRRAARARASAMAADHSVVAAALREREASLLGEDLHNARHLASELERHAAALERIVAVSPVGLQGSADLRPEALGCGKRYRDPAKAPAGGEQSGSSGHGKRAGGKPGGGKPGGGGRTKGGGDERRSKRPFDDRGPKVDRGMLGTGKHDSALGDDLDEATRAKLEALRAQLED